MTRDVIVTPPELFKMLQQPGQAFVFSILTNDDEVTVQIIKADLIHTLQEMKNTTVSIDVQIDRENGVTRLFIGW